MGIVREWSRTICASACGFLVFCCCDPCRSIPLFTNLACRAAIRTDNGAPFASTALAGLSRLAVWWIKLGIVPERIAAGHPEQNGRHERMHRTLKQEVATPPAKDRRAQQRALERFRQEYNLVSYCPTSLCS
jgi:transposase InsO family protein